LRVLRLENVAESVGTLVAEIFGVGKLAYAERVTDDDDCAGFHTPIIAGARMKAEG